MYYKRLDIKDLRLLPLFTNSETLWSILFLLSLSGTQLPEDECHLVVRVNNLRHTNDVV